MVATVGDVMKTFSRMGCPPWRLMYATGEAGIKPGLVHSPPFGLAPGRVSF